MVYSPHAQFTASSDDATRAAGLWEGVPLTAQELPRTANRDDLLPDHAIGFTIAVGYRYLAGGHELYLAPKLYYAWNQAY